MDSPNPTTPRDLFGSFGVKMYRFRTLIRRQWWIMAITIGIGLAYQGWIVYKKPRVFESTSKLNIREEMQVDSQAVVSTNQWAESFINNNLTMLKSPEVIERARQRMALQNPHLTGPTPEMSSDVIARTTIFTIKGVGANPEYTQKFVDAVVAEFVEFRREDRNKLVGDVSGSYEERVNRVKLDLQEHQAALQAFQAKNNMPFWTDQLQQSAEFLSNLKTKQAQLQTELQRLEHLTPDQLLSTPPTTSMKTASGGTVSVARAMPANQPEAADSTVISQSLYSQYVQTVQDLNLEQARYDERSKVWKQKHPRLQAIQSEITRLKRLLSVIKEQNQQETAARIVAIKAELESLEKNIETWNQKVLEASGKDAEYKTLLKNVERTDSIMQTLLSSRAKIDSADTGLDLFTILQRATPPSEVPKRAFRHILIGLFGGLIVGLVILALLDRADDRVTSSSEVLTHFTEPILAQIPNVIASRGETGLPLLSPDDDRYSYAEAFRSLRSSLIFMPNQSELKTILITSAIPNEGKSTIASNLAVTMAAAGANTIIVDADLRRGDLASLFDADGRTGLSNILRREVPWEEVVQNTRFPNLSLIPRGPVTNQSGELLLLPSLEALLDGLSAKYDLVLFNTAPILATDDTPTLAPHFDGSLMVMRAQFTSARLTRNALNALYQRQVNVLGLVLNCVDTDMPDYYYYRYPKYYAA